MTHHPSFGTIVKWDPAGGTSYVAIGQVKDIEGPGLSRGDVDVTTQDSTSGYKEYLPGNPDGGELTFAISLDPNNTAHVGAAGTGLVNDFTRNGCTMPAWEITLQSCGSNAVWTFDGYPKTFTPTYAVEGELESAIAVKVTGVPTLTIS